MSVLWVVPVVVLAVGAIALAVVTRQAADEAARLRHSYASLQRVQDELTGLGSDVAVSRRQLADVAGNAGMPSLRAPWRR
jgi:hypothetical protein